MKCFIVVAALVAAAVAEAEPSLGYGLAAPYGLAHGAIKTIRPLGGPIGYAGAHLAHGYAGGYAGAPLAHGYAGGYAAAPIAAAGYAAAPIAAAHYAAPVAAAPIAAAPVVAAAPVPAGPVSSQYHSQDEFGNYNYGYNNINSAKQESGNAYTGVQGSYSYVDSYGLPQKVQYVADALGFRASGTNFPTTAATLGLHRRRRSVIGAYGASPLGYAGAYGASPLGYAGAYGLGYAGAHGYGAYPYATNAYAAGYAAPAYAGHAIAAPAYAGHAIAAAPVAAAPVAAHLGYAAPAAIVPSAPAAREAILTKVKLTPGHAEAYRVY